MAGSVSSDAVPSSVKEAVLMPTSMKLESPIVVGYDFNEGCDLNKVAESYITTGFQATSLGRAVEILNEMLDWDLSHEPVAADEEPEFQSSANRKNVRCKIFLAFTSNLVSSGTRETIRFLVQHKMVQVMVTSAGGIEEDLIKCLAPTHLGDFALPGASLRRQGVNRIGNLLVPNSNYCAFEDWITPILHKMSDEQEKGTLWTPSTFIHRLGLEINDPSSIYYWCAHNNIPVFCPALTDGSIGDMLYAHSYRRPGFILDVVGDIRRINDEALRARKTGVLILGGGMAKHHTLNANLMRNGTDFAVFVNTGQEFDGSDSGARPDEATSWGKLRINAKSVKVYADAAIVLPLLVGQSFARRFHAGLINSSANIIFDKSYTPSEHAVEKQRLLPTSKDTVDL